MQVPRHWRMKKQLYRMENTMRQSIARENPQDPQSVVGIPVNADSDHIAAIEQRGNKTNAA